MRNLRWPSDASDYTTSEITSCASQVAAGPCQQLTQLSSHGMTRFGYGTDRLRENPKPSLDRKKRKTCWSATVLVHLSLSVICLVMGVARRVQRRSSSGIGCVLVGVWCWMAEISGRGVSNGATFGGEGTGMDNLRCGALFAGAGALELAVGGVLGARPVWFVENDPAATKVLERHWPGVPNHGDITAVDWTGVDPVDVLTGGFPCTDVSSAGKRAGLRPGTRSGLWSHMAYAISQLRPKLVIIENVRGLLSTDAHCDLEPCPWCLGDNEGRPLRALGAVLGDLASLGYVGRWHGLRASDVGAPHGRFRVFITAWPVADPDGGELQRRGRPGVLDGASGSGEGEGPEREWDRYSVGDRGPVAPDTSRDGRAEGRPEPAGQFGGSDVSVGGDGVIADPHGVGPIRSGEARGWRGGSEDHGDVVAAHSAGPGWGWDQQVNVCGDSGEEVRSGQTEPGRRDSPVTYADGAGWGPGCGLGGPAGTPTVGGGRAVRSTRSWVSVDGTDYGPAIHRWETILGRPAPDPTVLGQRGGQQLSPFFTEWMQGWPDGWVTGVSGLSRNDQIKVCGNGVVPHQAVEALRFLLSGWCRQGGLVCG